MLSRRARPTIRALVEDLDHGWSQPWPARLLRSRDFDGLSPLSALPHPIIEKSVDDIGEDPSRDNPVGGIVSSRTIPLLEIKTGQWRGAVWSDPQSRSNWLIAAGTAKGGHQDHDDFYRRIERAAESGLLESWLPGEDDVRLLKRETAARILHDFELEIQSLSAGALERALKTGADAFAVPHPKSREQLATAAVEIDQGDDAVETVIAELDPAPQFRASALAWTVALRVLITLWPPEQDWDPHSFTFSNMLPSGSMASRLRRLTGICERKELAESTPGSQSHYFHTPGILESSVNGTAVKSLCGVYIVTRQNPDGLPVCPECTSRRAHLPDR